MKLRELLGPLPEYRVAGRSDIEITDVVYDSRKADEGAVFFCIKGLEADGHDYAPAAVERGAGRWSLRGNSRCPVPSRRWSCPIRGRPWR